MKRVNGYQVFIAAFIVGGVFVLYGLDKLPLTVLVGVVSWVLGYYFGSWRGLVHFNHKKGSDQNG